MRIYIRNACLWMLPVVVVNIVYTSMTASIQEAFSWNYWPQPQSAIYLTALVLVVIASVIVTRKPKYECSTCGYVSTTEGVCPNCSREANTPTIQLQIVLSARDERNGDMGSCDLPISTYETSDGVGTHTSIQGNRYYE